MKLTDQQSHNLSSTGHDPAEVQDKWDADDYGTLVDYDRGDHIREATQAEAAESFDAGYAGVIVVDGISVFVRI